MDSLLKNINISLVLPTTDVTAGSTLILSTQLGFSGPVDMQGFDGVMFLANLSGSTATSVVGGCYIYPTFGSSSGTLTADTSAIAGTSAFCTTAGAYFLALDIFKPTQRYVGFGLGRLYNSSTAIFYANVYAIQYKAHKGATTQSTGSEGGTMIGATTASTGFPYGSAALWAGLTS